MHRKQYNNVIEWTLEHDESAKTSDSLATARAICNNLGVPLPQGDCKEVLNALETGDYMGWTACTAEEAQNAANNGEVSIAINESDISIISAEDEIGDLVVSENAVTMPAVVGSGEVIDQSSPAQYYTYSNTSTQTSLYFEEDYIEMEAGESVNRNRLWGQGHAAITWRSTNPAVATIHCDTATITTKRAGLTTITATATDGRVASYLLKVLRCGGDNYRDVTRHNMVLNSDEGCYICTRCGYRVDSPEVEDIDILSIDDYLKVISVMEYSSQCELLARNNPALSGYYYLQIDYANLYIDTIRSQSQYASKYSYINSSGVYHCSNINNNLLSLVDIVDINLLNIGLYNGVYESIASAVVGYYCPQVAVVVDTLNLLKDMSEGEMSALDFGAFVAGMYEDVSENMAKCAKGLTIASTVLGMVESDVSTEDRVVRINLDFRASVHCIYDEDNKVKEVRIFYNP